VKIGAILLPAAFGTIRSAFAGPPGPGGGPPPPPPPGGGPRGGINCFLKGTKIRTVAGERKIEDLAIGDLLPTMFGGVRPIQWIGHYPFKPWVKDAQPVRIARSALAPDVPHADLYATAAHFVHYFAELS